MNNDDTEFTPPSDEGTSGAGVPDDRLPLGFWLRTVDGLINREFAAAFQTADLDRRDWMLLTALSGDVELPAFAERFIRKGKRLRALAERGWVDQTGDGTWVLTDEGRAAKESLAAVVDGIRSRVAAAVSPEDFATTLASLEAIAREFGWEEGQRMPRRGFGRRFGPGARFAPGAGFGPGFGRGFGPDAHDAPHCHPRHEHGAHHHGEHRHGEHRHGEHRHGEHRHGRGGRAGQSAERAYERGFEAGFTRGRSGDRADAG